VAAIIAQPQTLEAYQHKGDTFWVPVDNVRLTLAHMAAAFYPQQPESLVAVTGTNGKSSVVHFVRQLAAYAGVQAASMGTLGVQASRNLTMPDIPKLTTFDAISFHQVLWAMAQQGITLTALEASSHGLDQCRIHGARLKAAGFTNVTQDHLDYHRTMEAYVNAKARLFTQVLPKGATAVLNQDSPAAAALIDLCHARSQQIITYSVHGARAALSATNLAFMPQGITFTLGYEGRTFPNLTLPLVGGFQLENVLCALGLLMGCGFVLEGLLPHVNRLTPVEGRMAHVADYHGAFVYVDYAHTPDALAHVLGALRAHCAGRLHVVFGCGGDRDATKRPLMGAIAAQHGDVVYITDDNPRTEEPAAIRASIKAACPKGREIPNREEAIHEALEELKPGDILVIAGKGHEDGQIIGSVVHPFNDAAVVNHYIARNAS
jgi:UDP-N-acetylmuramoyl-L-alanyl-D-glutamate--2,6-diaminopimelate ligase